MHDLKTINIESIYRIFFFKFKVLVKYCGLNFTVFLKNNTAIHTKIDTKTTPRAFIPTIK